ncbi:hypothetical protein [Limnoraphis robusta]|uniref:hypothetical protein n=1 Tax=Limnoraphis robusta TaxID=1118279 RepID=UPI001364C030|nr:hypothetical protein [Limnoraphis robusta]
MPTTLPMRWFSPFVLRFALVVRLSILSRQVRQEAIYSHSDTSHSDTSFSQLLTPDS